MNHILITPEKPSRHTRKKGVGEFNDFPSQTEFYEILGRAEFYDILGRLQTNTTSAPTTFPYEQERNNHENASPVTKDPIEKDEGTYSEGANYDVRAAKGRPPP